ncbi:MAG: four helix bundle protein [Bacteroidota bacterium]
MNPQHLVTRTKLLAVGILNMVKELPKVYPSQTMANQLIRAATSVGANYRSACKSKSAKDFIYKMKVVEEELDETIYWLELIGETHVYMRDILTGLHQEATELMLIVIQSLRTVRTNHQKKQSQLHK